MTDQESTVARGRPPGPSLSNEAVSILERNAFTALRGPNSRGAVPRSAFQGIDVSTVDRSVKREFPGETGRAPFDLASHQVCSPEGATRATLQAVFEVVEQSFRETDAMEITLRVFLRANFIEATKEAGVLAAVIVQAAACAQVAAADDGASGQLEAAHEVIDMRQQLYAEMTEGLVAGLSIALRRLRRRPKAAHTLADIVTAVIATSDGFVLLHKLRPELIDPELVVETQWSVIWGMTEPGLLDPPNPSTPAERSLVEAAIFAYSEGRSPVLEQLARECEVSLKTVTELFGDDDGLAQRCMDYAVGSSVETQAIAVNVKGAELAAVRDLLIATTRQATASPRLIEVVRKDPNRGFCAEARRHIAEALSQSESVELDRSTADGVATMLLDAALQGRAGLTIWQAGLDAFAVPS
jgi:hypothetical protein